MKKWIVFLLFTINIAGLILLALWTYDRTEKTAPVIGIEQLSRGTPIDTVNTGSGPNTGTGDPLRTAFGKINEALNLINTLKLYDYTTQIDSALVPYSNPAYDLTLGDKNIRITGNVGSYDEMANHGYFEDVTVRNPLRANIWYDSILFGDGERQSISGVNLKDMEILGSSVKAMTLGLSISETKAQVTMVDNSIKFIPVYVRTTQTITGVNIGVQTQGNYTADNYNGVGLYKYNTTLDSLVLVASSTDDGNIWKASSGSMITKAFTTAYSAEEGLYYVACLWNASATTTAPSVYGTTPGIWVGSLLTSGYFVAGAEAGQNTLPSKYKASDINTSSTSYLLFLY